MINDDDEMPVSSLLTVMWQEGQREACLRSQRKLVALHDLDFGGLLVSIMLSCSIAAQRETTSVGSSHDTLLVRCKIGDLSSQLFQDMEKVGWNGQPVLI